MADSIEYALIETKGRLVTGQSRDTTDLMARATDMRAFDPSVFDDHPPVFFPVEISNNNVDSYFTFMDDTTLQNFASGADAGVSVQDSHKTDSLPFGHSLTGRFVSDGQRKWVESDFYTIPGLAGRDGKRSDDYILGIRAGIYRDISVGFHLGEEGIIRCNICGGDMMEWWGDCTHWPGERYTVPENPEKADGPTTEVVALGIVENAILSEYSTVYDGATPGAGILKAERMIAAGEMSAKQKRVLESMYRHALPDVREYWSLSKREADMAAKDQKRDAEQVDVKEEEAIKETIVEVNLDGEGEDPDDNRQPEGEAEDPAFELDEGDPAPDPEPEPERKAPDVEYFEKERTRLAARGLRINEANPYRAAVQLADKVLELRDKIKTNEAEAQAGRQYKDDLIKDALDEGVRALGAEFDRDKHEAILRRTSTTIEDIRLFRSTWQAQGDDRFGRGRVTRERNIRLVPDEADDTFVDQA